MGRDGPKLNCPNSESVQTASNTARNRSHWVKSGYGPIQKYEPIDRNWSKPLLY